MSDAYTDILLRIFPYDASTECYPVEAELDDGSRFSGGKLRLDREALLTVELDPKAYGLLLFNALFAGDIRRAYDKATGIAEVQSGGRLRVRLWVDNEAVELHAVAWERLYHVYRGRAVPLTTSTLTPFSRYTSLEMRDPPPISETPVRMLIAVSNPLDLPGGLMPANIEIEVESLRQALGDLQSEGKVQVTLLPGRTGLSPDLQKKVLAAGWQIAEGITDLDNLTRLMTGAHIFHFIGHGHFRRKTEHGAGQAALFLEKEDGRWQAVTDDEIVSTLTSAGTLPHLVFLVACESATRDVKAESPFVGLGPRLVQTGVPAVVAMQAQVPVELARQLSGEFYRRLMEHGEVDQALNQARLIVFDGDRTEWAIPVLFMRMKRGKLFGEPEGDEEAPAPGAPPYKGLEYFDEKDADKFFGREALVARLAGQLRQSRFLAVILGASGSGKSSVVRAGLIPALKRGRPLFDNTLPPEGSPRWPIHTFTPGTSPLEALAATLTRDEASVTATAILHEDLQRDPRSLHLYVRKLISRADSKHLMLIVDQFEELFTLCKDDAQRKAFVDNLIYASAEAADGPTVVVIIFRADFYAHCAQFANLREAVSKRQEFIGPMSHDELRRAIEEPAKQGGWDLEPGLVDVLLQDVGDEPGALPLLQHALLETWKRRRGRTMTLRGYTESGGIRGAIAKTAEAVYQQLPLEKQATAKRIFLRLVELGEGTQDTRRRAELSELSPRPEERPLVDEVLKTLVDNRLVTTTATTAEVSHEALIREWPTLREWLDKNRAGIRVHRDLAEAAREWDNLLREPGGLYRGVRLVQAMERAEEDPGEMNALESEFLAASKAEAEREANEKEERQRRELEAARRLAEEQSRVAEAAQKLADAESQRAAEQARAAVRQRTLSRIMTGVGVVAFIAALIAAQQWFAANQLRAVAVGQRSTALAASTQAVEQQLLAVTERAKAEAERANADVQRATAQAASTQAVQNAIAAEEQARLAFAGELAAHSLALPGTDLDLSLLLSLEAYSLDPSLPSYGALLTQASKTPAVAHFLRGHTDKIISLAFSPDGTVLASGSVDTTVRLWDAETGQPIGEPLRAHTLPVYAVAFSPRGDVLASAGYEGKVYFWEAATGRQLGEYATADGDAAWSLAFSPVENLLAVGTGVGSIEFVDLNTLERRIEPLTDHIWAVLSMAFSPDGTTLASGSWDSSVRLWDVATGQQIGEPIYQHSFYQVWAVSFDSTGELLATGGGDGSVGLWEVGRGEAGPEVPTTHNNRLSRVGFIPDGRLGSASSDNTVEIWDSTTNGLEHLLRGYEGPVDSVAFTDDGSRFASGTGTTIVLWNPDEPHTLGPTLQHEQEVWSVAYSRDGQTIATGDSDGNVRLWDAATGQQRGEPLTGHTAGITSLAHSPDGKYLASASNDSTIRLWDAATGQLRHELTGHTERIWRVAFSPDSQMLASASDDDDVRLWSVETGAPLGEPIRVAPGVDYVYGVAFSPTEPLLAIASSDNKIYLWDSKAGQFRGEPLRGHTDQVWSVAFSPDGKRLASSAQDTTVRLWDVETGQPIGEPLKGHTDVVRTVIFSPDGKRLISSANDLTVRLWDVASHQPIGKPLAGHGSDVYDVAVSPDGTHIVSASLDGTARVWSLDVPTLEAVACTFAGRNLTQAEWSRYMPEGLPYHKTCAQWPEGE